jgi:succinate-semialdehyde dehydrogenase/glutarate-semialdehyde dehydrogenase
MDVQRDVDAPMQLFIGGKFVDASDGGVFEVIDPATERSLGAVANGTIDAQAAVAAAAAARGRPPRARAEILRRAFELIVAQQEPLARLITRERQTLADARGEIATRRVLPLVPEEAVRNIGRVACAELKRIWCSTARRHRGARDAVEFSAAM